MLEVVCSDPGTAIHPADEGAPSAESVCSGVGLRVRHAMSLERFILAFVAVWGSLGYLTRSYVRSYAPGDKPLQSGVEYGACTHEHACASLVSFAHGHLGHKADPRFLCNVGPAEILELARQGGQSRRVKVNFRST